jgi:uncharacterized protein (TIGR02118 family)
MAGYILALYGEPTDPDEFDAYYDATHVPIAARIPGLRGGGVSVGPALAPDGTKVFHRAGVLVFDTLDAARAALATPEGQETAADLANFATGGVTLAMFELREVPLE